MYVGNVHEITQTKALVVGDIIFQMNTRCMIISQIMYNAHSVSSTISRRCHCWTQTRTQRLETIRSEFQ